MKLTYSVKGNQHWLNILADNDMPANVQNPIQPSEYAEVQFPEISGGQLIISGMPMSAVAFVALRYKNTVSSIAIHNPRNKTAEVILTMSARYKLGEEIDLSDD